MVSRILIIIKDVIVISLLNKICKSLIKLVFFILYCLINNKLFAKFLHNLIRRTDCLLFFINYK